MTNMKKTIPTRNNTLELMKKMKRKNATLDHQIQRLVKGSTRLHTKNKTILLLALIDMMLMKLFKETLMDKCVNSK